MTWLAAIRRPCLAASAQARRTCAALQFEMPISLITPALAASHAQLIQNSKGKGWMGVCKK